MYKRQVDAAVADGYNVIVMPGYAFAETIKETAELYPDVTFIALDVYKRQGHRGAKEVVFSWGSLQILRIAPF